MRGAPLSRGMAGGGAGEGERATFEAAARGVVAIVDVAIGARISDERIRLFDSLVRLIRANDCAALRLAPPSSSSAAAGVLPPPPVGDTAVLSAAGGDRVPPAPRPGGSSSPLPPTPAAVSVGAGGAVAGLAGAPVFSASPEGRGVPRGRVADGGGWTTDVRRGRRRPTANASTAGGTAAGGEATADGGGRRLSGGASWRLVGCRRRRPPRLGRPRRRPRECRRRLPLCVLVAGGGVGTRPPPSPSRRCWCPGSAVRRARTACAASWPT